MATPPTPTSGALTVNSTTGVILSPVTAALFRSANGIGTGSGDVTASGTLTATRLILGNGTTSVIASDLTYSTPTLTVPAGFGITGAGSLAFTAGGSNQSIRFTPSGNGIIQVFKTGYTGGGANQINIRNTQDSDWMILGMTGTSTTSPLSWLTGIDNCSFLYAPSRIRLGVGTGASSYFGFDGTTFTIGTTGASSFSFLGGGTVAGATTLTGATTQTALLTANSGIRITGASAAISEASSGALSLKMGVMTGIPSASTDAFVAIQNTGGPGGLAGDLLLIPRSSAGVANAVRLFTGQTTIGASAVWDSFGRYTLNSAARTRAAWGVTGAVLEAPSATYTDSSSSGTVASAVANSFAVPTFAASSATTFTNAANLYIAGDVVNGTNVTLTNSYGLWNVGKTRLDGAVQLPSTNTVGFQLYNTTDQTTNYERLEMLWSSNVAILRPLKGGTGTYRTLSLGTDGVSNINLRAVAISTGLLQFKAASTAVADIIFYNFSNATSTATSGTTIGLSLTPTYNQVSGTAANTDLLINRTETAVGSGAQKLIDAQVASASKFNVNNAGLITTNSTTMIASNQAFTNGAAAQAGTLLNAPTAGNPTKWIPINDNGTTRYIPAW